MTLRSRFALRLVAALALCVPFAACDDKKTTVPSRSAPATGGARATDAPPPFNPPATNQTQDVPNTENHPHFVENDYASARA